MISYTFFNKAITSVLKEVLILIVVEDGLVQDSGCDIEDDWLVLILIVVEDGLVHFIH